MHDDMIILKPIKSSITKEIAGSLTKYIDPKKLGVPFSVIRDETQKKVTKYFTTKKM